MRTRLAIVAAALQVLVLAFMAGEREWVLRFGRPILLRTAPIDPNDPMRGEYARFNYDINSVPRALWRDGLPDMFPANTYDYRKTRDVRVYAALQVDDSSVAELVSLSDRRPPEGMFITGRVVSPNSNQLNVRYGIEALFMQQGESQKLEDLRRKDRPSVPLDAEISVNDSGLAVLRGYRWEPLGLNITAERETLPPTTAGNQNRRQPAMVALKIELKNYSTGDVAVVDLPDHRSFRIVNDNVGGQEIRYRWVGANTTAPAPQVGNVVVLKPGQSFSSRIDLTQAAWFVVDTKAPAARQQPMPLREVVDAWSARYRLEYSPPTKAASTGLPQENIIHHGRLRSRAFNPTQTLD